MLWECYADNPVKDNSSIVEMIRSHFGEDDNVIIELYPCLFPIMCLSSFILRQLLSHVYSFSIGLAV